MNVMGVFNSSQTLVSSYLSSCFLNGLGERSLEDKKQVKRPLSSKNISVQTPFKKQPSENLTKIKKVIASPEPKRYSAGSACASKKSPSTHFSSTYIVNSTEKEKKPLKKIGPVNNTTISKSKTQMNRLAKPKDPNILKGVSSKVGTGENFKVSGPGRNDKHLKADRNSLGKAIDERLTHFRNGSSIPISAKSGPKRPQPPSSKKLNFF
jgi:hypothetical protein